MSDGSIDWHVEQEANARAKARENLRDDVAQFLLKNHYHEKNSLEIADLLTVKFVISRK